MTYLPVPSYRQSMAYGVEMCDAEIYALPPVIGYVQAARAHGIGKRKAQQMRAAGTLPFPTRQDGRVTVTTRSQLLESLGLPIPAAPSATISA